MEHWWNDTDRGKPKCSEKPRLTAILFTTNPTHWPATEPMTLEWRGQQLPTPFVTKNSVKK